MQEIKQYEAIGAKVTISAVTFPKEITLSIMVDFSELDKGVGIDNYLIHYLNLSGYTRNVSCGYRQVQHFARVETAAQAREFIRVSLLKIEDAVEKALCKRAARIYESKLIFP